MSKEAEKSKAPEEEGPRSFTVMLSGLADGEAERELASNLHELCKRLQEEAITRQDKVKGALTLKLKLTAEPKGFVAITYDVEAKAPKRRTSAAVMWLTKGGNLSPHNPRQERLPLREVAAPAAEVRNLEPAPAAREV